MPTSPVVKTKKSVLYERYKRECEQYWKSEPLFLAHFLRAFLQEILEKWQKKQAITTFGAANFIKLDQLLTPG